MIVTIIIALQFLGGHHLYMNLCVCVRVCVCLSQFSEKSFVFCSFVRPPLLVRSFVPLPLIDIPEPAAGEITAWWS